MVTSKPVGTKKVRKGDKVLVLAGNNRGQTGTVLSCRGDKVVIQGLNMRKKHIKRTQEAPKGRIVEIEKPIHVSNVKVCVEGDTGAKLKVRTDKHGQRQLVYSKGDKEVVYRSVKKPKE